MMNRLALAVLVVAVCSLSCWPIPPNLLAQDAVASINSNEDPEVLEQKIALLIDQLNAKSYRQREKATADLIDIGMPTIRQVALTMLDRVPEQSCRCADILNAIGEAAEVEDHVKVIRVMHLLQERGFYMVAKSNLESIRNLKKKQTKRIVDNLHLARIEVETYDGDLVFDKAFNELLRLEFADIADDLDAARTDQLGIELETDVPDDELFQLIADNHNHENEGEIIENAHLEETGFEATKAFREMVAQLDAQANKKAHDDSNISMQNGSVELKNDRGFDPSHRSKKNPHHWDRHVGNSVSQQIQRILDGDGQPTTQQLFDIDQFTKTTENYWQGLTANSIIVAKWEPEFHFAPVAMHRVEDLHNVTLEYKNCLVDIATARCLSFNQDSRLDKASRWLSQLDSVTGIKVSNNRIDFQFLKLISRCQVIRNIEIRNCNIDLVSLRAFCETRPGLNIEIDDDSVFGIRNPERFSSDHTAVSCTVRKFEANSFAEKIGLRKGDTIVGINDTKINCYRDLVFDIAQRQSGEQIEIILYRNGRKGKITTTLQPRTKNEQTTDDDDDQVVRPRQDFYMPK